MNFLTSALAVSCLFVASAFAIDSKEMATCMKDGKQVGEARMLEVNWSFHSPHSACPVNNADYCNVYEVACEGTECTTELKPANWQVPNIPF